MRRKARLVHSVRRTIFRRDNAAITCGPSKRVRALASVALDPARQQPKVDRPGIDPVHRASNDDGLTIIGPEHAGEHVLASSQRILKGSTGLKWRSEEHTSELQSLMR